MAVFLLDTFTDSGVYLYRNGGAPTHVGELGATWTKHPSGLDFGFGTQTNRAYCNSGPAFDYASATPPSADYFVEAVLLGVTDIANDGQLGICGRLDVSADTCYTMRYQNAANTWIVEERLAGVATSLGTYAEADWTGAYRTIRLEMIGTSIDGYIDGTLRINGTSSAITAAGVVGLRSPNSAATTTGIHIDSITADDNLGSGTLLTYMPQGMGRVLA